MFGIVIPGSVSATTIFFSTRERAEREYRKLKADGYSSIRIIDEQGKELPTHIDEAAVRSSSAEQRR